MLPPDRPASIFVLFSLAFGSIIIFTNPPLRGPDEIAPFSANLLLRARRASAGHRN
jgi:hypothetical protein